MLNASHIQEKQREKNDLLTKTAAKNEQLQQVSDMRQTGSRWMAAEIFSGLVVSAGKK